MGKLRIEIGNYLRLDSKKVSFYIDKSDKFYKRVLLQKRSGGTRVIYMPSSEIKMIQHFLVEKYFSRINTSEHATAYIKGKSIIHNAHPHLNNQYFLLVDIVDFFNNLQVEEIRHLIKKQFPLLDDLDINDMIKLSTHNNTFPQGAVSSPIISNIYMRDFDDQISKIVESTLENGKYTRYSDDITISSSKLIKDEILHYIDSEMNKIKLNINNRKTYLTSNKQKIEITGLKIVGNKISLSTDKKKKIKNMIYHKLKHGKNSFQSANTVLGYLNYVKSVDPLFYNKLNKKYKKDKENLLTRLRNHQLSEFSNGL